MKNLIVATKNPGKAKEFQTLFSQFGVSIQSLLDLEETVDVEETGTTFQENARLKAEEIAKIYKTVTLSDDSGLIVDALDGKPGVYSARYAGEEKNDQANLEKVLVELEGVPEDERTARFCTVLALAEPGKPTTFYEGYCEGVITREPKGNHGFGYDPIFFLPDYQKTMAELSSQEKNKISHRANAMAKLKKDMEKRLG